MGTILVLHVTSGRFTRSLVFIEIASALGNVGLTTGVTDPALPWFGKLGLIIMWLGRLDRAGAGRHRSADARLAPTRAARRLMDSSHEIPLEAKVAFLRRATSFADRPAKVEAIETHMSWVFLTERHAYKLKKPVRTGFLDFGSIAARRRYCEAEVRLNQRLARGVYLGTVRLVVDRAGALQLGSEGRIVDWLVEMRRLPAEARLDVVIVRGAVDKVRLREALELVSIFYAESPPIAMAPSTYRCRIAREIGADRDVLAIPDHRVPPKLTRRVIDAQFAFLDDHGALIDARAERVIEGHGDLRPEHVYLLAEPVVVDRLEFNRDLRIVDPAEELAFLAMECALLGERSVGETAFEAYRRLTGDLPPASVVAFYRSRRACVRARLAIWHLDDPTAPVASRWLDLAVRYLESAERDLAVIAG